MMIKRVAAMNDLSGLGRCSLTMDLPVLSAMGVQCCPIPTSVLSSQTDGYSGYSICDLTDELGAYIGHWFGMNERFDGIMTGYLGSSRQIDLVRIVIEKLKKPDSVVLVDPVMGDDGALYPSLDEKLCDDIRNIVSCADVITPNLTEAAILLGKDFSASDESVWSEWSRELMLLGPKSVVITGIDAGNDRLCTVSCDRGRTELYYTEKIACSYPGTGDMFAAAAMGRLLNGADIDEAARFASDFTGKCVEYTYKQKTPRREGLVFEPLLKELLP